MMKVLCVDDEPLVLNDTVELCRKLSSVTEVTGFDDPIEAENWFGTHQVDVAVMDIHMPGISGLTLAGRLLGLQPNAKVIFLTKYPQYAVQAFKVRASGYLLKPASARDLEEEIAYAASRALLHPSRRIVVKTFGSFEIFADGETLPFRRAKSKELLAYLIDCQGKGVNRPTIFAALWGDKLYGHSQQKYLDVVIRSLRDTLRSAGIEDILEIKSGFLRIRPEMLDCDLYRFLQNDPEAVNSYRGEYLRDYEWALLNNMDSHLK